MVILRFETKKVASRMGYVDFENCGIHWIKGISGITQYEDEAQFLLKNPSRLYLPDFCFMHYCQYEVALEDTPDTCLVLCEGNDRIRVPLSAVTDKIQDFDLNDVFQIRIFRWSFHETGTISVTPREVPVRERVTMHITYEVTGEPIRTGGKIRILTPFSCWTEPCENIKERFFPHTRTAELTVIQQPYTLPFRGTLYEVTVTGGILCPGDRLEILHTNLHHRGILSQPYPQKDIYYLGWEDSSGQGIFNHIPLCRCGHVSVVPGPPARIRLAAQQLCRPEEDVAVRLLAMDAWYNPVPFAGDITLSLKNIASPDKAYTQHVSLADGRGGAVFHPEEGGFAEGLYLLEASCSGLRTERLSLYISRENCKKLYFGQLHAHSEVSDGTFSMEDYFAYGRDEGMLDFCALSDHDWELVEHSRNRTFHRLERLTEICNSFNEPGKYATLVGYEWMDHWAGHMNVYFRSDKNCEIYPGFVSLLHEYPQFPHQKDILAKFRGRRDVLVLPHFSHGFQWEEYDEALQRAAEVYSMWGYSEEKTACLPTAEGFVRHLADGRKFAFLGGADSHHGMPGQTGLRSKYSMLSFREGLTAVYADSLSRETVFDAIQGYAAYATTGERILILPRFHVEGDSVHLSCIIGGTASLCGAEVIGNQGRCLFYTAEGRETGTKIEAVFPRMRAREGASEFYYLKVTQEDGEKAYLNLLL